MSDGPFRSLPMSPSWKKVAEFSDNENFDLADISSAMDRALKKNWRDHIPADLMDTVRGAFLVKQGGLFGYVGASDIESCERPTPGRVFARLFYEHSACSLAEGKHGEQALIEAVKQALTAGLARNARQIEEHYVRKASVAKTRQVRARLEDAIGQLDLGAIARKLCGFKTVATHRKSWKHKAVDDGVPI